MNGAESSPAFTHRTGASAACGTWRCSSDHGSSPAGCHFALAPECIASHILYPTEMNQAGHIARSHCQPVKQCAGAAVSCCTDRLPAMIHSPHADRESTPYHAASLPGAATSVGSEPGTAGNAAVPSPSMGQRPRWLLPALPVNAFCLLHSHGLALAQAAAPKA